MNNLDPDLAFKLWDIANIAVGFSVAQAMSFIYKCADKKFAKKLREDKKISDFTLILSISGLVIYIMLIWGCQFGFWALYKIDNGSVGNIWFIASCIRTIIIILFTLFSLKVLSLVLKSKHFSYK